MRLNRFLASAGLGSRRNCEELIRTGQVTVNGVLCENLSTTVEPQDVVKVGNRVLHTAPPATLLLNKPAGFICTASDTHDRRTIFELLPSNFPRLFHVGRLDRESEGLLILTNDGELALKLTHPKYKVDKEYEVVLDHAFDFSLTSKLLHGMSLEEGWAKAESVHRLAPNKLKVILRQGMKRQIRLMFYELGYEVRKLNRVRIGPIELQNMPLGSWRVLTQKEIDSLVAEGAKTGAEEAAAQKRAPKSRPAYQAGPRRAPREGQAPRPFKPKARGDAPRSSGSRSEEIPFTPRASRGEAPKRSARPEARPASPSRGGFKAKPAGKASGPKSAHSKAGVKPGRPAGKPTPSAFAKFRRRTAG